MLSGAANGDADRPSGGRANYWRCLWPLPVLNVHDVALALEPMSRTSPGLAHRLAAADLIAGGAAIP